MASEAPFHTALVKLLGSAYKAQKEAVTSAPAIDAYIRRGARKMKASAYDFSVADKDHAALGLDWRQTGGICVSTDGPVNLDSDEVLRLLAHLAVGRAEELGVAHDLRDHAPTEVIPGLTEAIWEELAKL